MEERRRRSVSGAGKSADDEDPISGKHHCSPERPGMGPQHSVAGPQNELTNGTCRAEALHETKLRMLKQARFTFYCSAAFISAEIEFARLGHTVSVEEDYGLQNQCNGDHLDHHWLCPG